MSVLLRMTAAPRLIAARMLYGTAHDLVGKLLALATGRNARHVALYRERTTAPQSPRNTATADQSPVLQLSGGEDQAPESSPGRCRHTLRRPRRSDGRRNSWRVEYRGRWSRSKRPRARPLPILAGGGRVRTPGVGQLRGGPRRRDASNVAHRHEERSAHDERQA